MSKLNKKDMLAALRPVHVQIEVEDFGEVCIRQVTIRETDALRAALKDRKEDESSEFGLRMLALSLSDESGARLFGDDEIDALRDAAGTKVSNLIRRALEVNGYRKPEGDAKN